MFCQSGNRRSVEERTRGNQLYQEAVRANIPLWTKQERLQESFPFYQRAFIFAKNDDEKASAKKNLGHAYRQMAGTFGFTKAEVGRLKYYMIQAVELYNSACAFGKSCKTEQWLSEIHFHIEFCVEAVQESVMLLETGQEEKLILLRKMATVAPDGLMKARCYLKLGEATFNAGIVAYEAARFRDCQHHMADCNEPLEEALKHGRSDVEICEEVQDFQERVYVHMCIAQSVSLRLQAESLFQEHLRSQESINFDFIWDIADMFKQCTLLVREQDVEQEAIGLSRLGKLFESILKLPEKGKGYYKRSFHLATALFPRTFNTKDWYKDCSQAVERYQKEVVQREEVKWQEERQPIMEQLKMELDELKKSFEDGYVVFLKYIYSKHPPKNKEHTLTGDGKTKKSVRMALVHYHTDRLKKDEDIKWYVLCEEICKMLSQKYEQLKGED